MPSVIRKKSYGSVRVCWLDLEELMRRLGKITERISREHPEVEKIVLFGSVAEGRAVPRSDVDVLIVGEFEGRFHERSLEFLSYFDDLEMPIDVFCYTPEEIEKVELAKNALSTGKVLYDRSKMIKTHSRSTKESP